MRRHAIPPWAPSLTLYAASKSSFVGWDSCGFEFDNLSTSLARVVQRDAKLTKRLVHALLVRHTSPPKIVVQHIRIGGVVLVPDQHGRAVVPQIAHIHT